jgi:hypothetical protein
MAFPSAAKQEEQLNELKSLAELFGVEVVESLKLPIVMVRVASGNSTSTITKRGEDFFATHDLPDVPMTYIGGGMFKYRVEV